MQAVVGASWRLRDRLVHEVVATWDGPVHRSSEPEQFESLVLGLDTPSLFEPAALYVIRADEAWLRKHRARLEALIGQPVTGGAILLVTTKLAKNERLGKGLAKAGTLHELDLPGPRQLDGWLVTWLLAQDHDIEQPRAVAAALAQHRGDDIDGLIAAFEQVVDYVGDEPVTAAAVNALIGGSVEEPIWAFTDAVLGGQAPRALRLLHAAGGMDAHQALGAIINELRRCLCSLATSDDGDAAAMAGARRGNLFHTRRRAQELGRRCLLRLMTGALQGQRQLRHSGRDPLEVLETFILNAQRVIRLGGGEDFESRRKKRRA